MGAGAQAATLYGPLKANFGSGYVAIDDGTPAQPGVSVMAKPGGSGQIVYDNWCTVEVVEGKVEVVQEEPPCAGHASASGKPHRLADWAYFTLPGAAIIGGLVFLFHDDDDKPASP